MGVNRHSSYGMVGEKILSKLLDPLIDHYWNKFINAVIKIEDSQRRDLSEIDPDRISGEAVALCVYVKNRGPKAANKCQAELRLNGTNSNITDGDNIDIKIDKINVNPLPWDNDGPQSEVSLNPGGGCWLVIAYLTGSNYMYFPTGSTLSTITPEWYCRSDLSNRPSWNQSKQDLQPMLSKGIPAGFLLDMNWEENSLLISGQTKDVGFKATKCVSISFEATEQGLVNVEYDDGK